VQSSISSGLITSSTSFKYALAKGSLAKEGYASSKVLVSNSSKIPLASNQSNQTAILDVNLLQPT
jgi:hypothetical protein